MKSIAKIKDYFKNLKEEKMQKSIKRQKEIAQKQEQKQMALDILSVSNDMQKKMDIKIKYGVNYGNTKKNYCRTIDEHNMEILFCNFIWNKLIKKHEQIAVIIKMSEKYFPNFALTKNDIVFEPKKSEIFFLDKDNKYKINYASKDFKNCYLVLFELMLMKEKKRDEELLLKINNYKSIYDFESVDDMKLLLVGKESLLSILHNSSAGDSIKKSAISLDNSSCLAERRAEDEVIDILDYVNFFAPELSFESDTYKRFIQKTRAVQDKFVEEQLGPKLDRNRAVVRCIFDLYYEKFCKGLDYKEILKHFDASFDEKAM